MRAEKISIATAKITGLKSNPYYFDSKCFWAWNIMFYESSTLLFDNLPYIWLSEDSQEEAKKNCDELKEQFASAGIYEGDKVAIMFKEGGPVMAIGRIGGNDWIDVEDHFRRKTFEELNIDIISLIVH